MNDKKMSKEDMLEEQKIRLKYFKKHMAEKQEGMSEEEKSREEYWTDDFIDDYTKWYAEEEGIEIPEEPQEQKEREELLTRNEWIRNSNSLDDSIRRLKQSINTIYFLLVLIIIILASPWAMGQLWEINW
ncbi:hypothetical protein OAR18_03235 [Candidatus Pseudothioglobus singularis]|nr:hypothetical protein [Candidatus Pseudothioglobus singularis]